VTVLPFDRAGVPTVYFASSAYMRQGGTPPGEGELRRYEAATACGVVEVSAATCATQTHPLADYMLQPPRDAGNGPSRTSTCRFLSPELELPALAASRLPPVTNAEAPHVAFVRTVLPGNDCAERTAVKLEVTDAKGQVKWSRAMPTEQDLGHCPGPP
jgi:hypothetical protein